jgi:hypothetical protein
MRSSSVASLIKRPKTGEFSRHEKSSYKNGVGRDIMRNLKFLEVFLK